MKLSPDTVFNLIAIGLAGYGGYMLFETQGSAPQSDMMKYLISAAAGVVYLLYSNRHILQSRKEEPMFEAPDDLADIAFLLKLRDKLASAKNEDGVALCEKLNQILFRMTTLKEKKVEEVEEKVDEKVS